MLALVALSLMSASSCATTPRDAVHYSGARHEPSVGAPQLLSAASLPLGYQRLGRLSTSCNAWVPGSPVDEEWLVDLDCTERRLRLALREKAAAVGGQVLVSERCGSQRRATRSARHAATSSERLMCLADVARADAVLRAQQPLGDFSSPAERPRLGVSAYQAEQLDDPTGTAAWRIRVSYWPSERQRRPHRSAATGLRTASEVGELSDLPPSHDALGTLRTACERDCSEAAMRASVRVAAGRLGGSDVVGVRCVPRGGGYRCVGTLAAPRTDR